MRWPGKAWVDAHPVEASEIFTALVAVMVAGYFIGAMYIAGHFISKYW